MFFGRDLYRIRVKITTETLPRCRRKTTANPCTSYLGHPFKNMLLEKGKILPPCLQTKVGEDKIGSRQHVRTTTISCKGVAYFVGRVLTYLLQLRGFCLDVLHSCFLHHRAQDKTSDPCRRHEVSFRSLGGATTTRIHAIWASTKVSDL